MNYIDAIARDIATACDDPQPTADDMALYRIYGVLALVKGEAVNAQDVHDAWSAWMSGKMPEHWSIIPFGQLKEIQRDMDEPYAEAIRTVAQRMRVAA